MDIGAFGKGKGKQSKGKHGKGKVKGKQGQQGQDKNKDKDESTEPRMQQTPTILTRRNQQMLNQKLKSVDST